MRVLFVSSGRGGKVSILVQNQGESVRNAGIEVDFFIFKGIGLKGYFKSLPALRKTIIQGRYDLVHAHYSVSAIITTLASRTPVVVSLMGSDIYGSFMTRSLIRCLAKRRWSATIVKTDKMYDLLNLKRAVVIPNGVNLDFFRHESRNIARERLNIPAAAKIVLFVSTHDRPEKNFSLAQKSVSLLKEEGIELLYVKNAEHALIPSYLNAADLLLLTSVYEGSPNIVKEAMACNCPIVSTDVGDVQKIFGNTRGCYLTTYDPAEIASKIMQAMDLRTRTEGRQRIISLGLDSSSVARRIIDIYKSVADN